MVRPPAAAGIATATEAWTAACVPSTAVPGLGAEGSRREPKGTEGNRSQGELWDDGFL